MVIESILNALESRVKSNELAITNQRARVYDIYLVNEAINITDYRLGTNYIDRVYDLTYEPYDTIEQDLEKTNNLLKDIISDIKKELVV